MPHSEPPRRANTAKAEHVPQAASPPEAAAKIKTAQRAWIAYRDAYMGAMYPAKDKQAEYGSIYPMEADLLRAKLTQRHDSVTGSAAAVQR